MRIAMIGTKGVPSLHGGVERHVEELGARLVELGHEVTVFTRPNYTDRHLREHRGMRLVSIPTIGTKHLDAIVHSVLASFACWGGGYDIVHYHAMGPCLASPVARVRGRRVVATIHGQDWRRAKWGRLASTVLRLSEYMALHVPHVTISVSETLAQEYREKRGRPVEFIPNGVVIEPGDDTSVLDEFGLTDGGYVLFAGRIVPEKRVHSLLEAHRAACTGLKLAIVGDSSNSDEYVQAQKTSAGTDVVFTGYQYGARLAAMFRHAALFVLPSDLEGFPIVLLEALAYGAPVLASDIPPNVEVLGADGCYFAAGDVPGLTRALADCTSDVARRRAEAAAMRDRILRDYDWGRVAAKTVDCYRRAMGLGPAEARPAG